MSKQRIMLINGCSHTAGYEIDGTDDSEYNRAHSFGNQLAEIRGYTPINIALGSQSNPAIARGILDWFHKEYDANTMEVYVCIGWTESTRIDFPSPFVVDYKANNPAVDFYCAHTNEFLQINSGWHGNNHTEQEIIPYWHDFQVRHPIMLEMISVNTVLQIQYFLNMLGVDYVMCNTMHMFTTPCKYLNFYFDLVDQTKYFEMLDNDQAFYWYYRNQGLENVKARYWHHGEQAHLLQAQRLNSFIKQNS